MELVSVIIPAYNSENFIASAIDSVISQTYPHIEIIVVDDGSTDMTATVARDKLQKEFRGPWRVMELGRNKGVNVARNVAWRAAQGCWIQCLDSDDFLSPAKIEVQMAALAEASLDVAAVYSSYQPVFVEGTHIAPAAPIRSPNVENKAPIIFLPQDSYLMHQTCLLRRSVLDQLGGFDETLRGYEEVELLVRIANRGWRFKFVPTTEPSYLWRWYRDQPREGGAEARYSVVDGALFWIEVAIRATEGQPLSNICLSSEDRESVLKHCTSYARRVRIQDRGTFRKYMAKARILDPNFKPTGPWYLSFLSRIIGYEHAEDVAQLTRGPRKLIQSALAVRDAGFS